MSTRCSFVCLVAMMLLIGSSLQAQELPFAPLNIADGLEDTVIFSITQDQAGFLWVSTRTGINRYDGHRFWTYNQDHGLPHNLARQILEDSNGVIWAVSEAGLARFDGERFLAIDENQWPKHVSGRAIAEAPDGSLWVATYGLGVLQISPDPQPKIIDRFNTQNQFPTDRVRSVMIDSNGVVWTGTSSQVIKIQNRHFEIIPWVGKSSEIRGFFEHKNGEIWAATQHGIYVHQNNQFVPMNFGLDLTEQSINVITQDRNDHIWIGSRDNGAYQLDQQGQLMAHYDMHIGLPDNSVNALFQDREQNMWFGTYGAGLARLSTTNVTNWKAQNGMPNPNVYAITDDPDGCIWIGTNGNGVSHMCDDQITHISIEDGLSHNKVLTTMIDHEGNPWFGTLQGLNQLKGGEFIHYDESSGLSGAVVYHIIQAQNHSLWIGTNNGLDHMQNGEITAYNSTHGLPNNRINRILESNNGGLWLASSNGLTQYRDQRFTNWSADDGLAANFINDFYEDNEGGLWIATNNGLSYFRDGQFKTWTIKDGLPHNNCTTIIPGAPGVIWVGTSRGVAIYDGREFTVITSREGLVFDLINRGSGYKDPAGNIWFGTGEGLSRFDANFKTGSTTPPPVHLLSIHKNNQSLDLSQRLSLPQPDSRLNINFTAISFQRAPDIIYRYRLATDTQSLWRETRLSEIQIDSLAAGDYRFEVSARIGNGAWNPMPAQYEFVVTPPFWRTAWFMLISAAIVLAAVFYRQRLIKKRADLLEKLVHQRTQELEAVNDGLDWLANHDSLTRLANRNQIQKHREALESGHNHGVMILDLDHFKKTNDIYGHDVGDEVLVAFANMLREQIRENDLAARWGGEEFLLICQQGSVSAMRALAERLLVHTRQILIASKPDLKVRCSIGFTHAQLDEASGFEKAMKVADDALYQAKNNGRDQAVGFVPQTLDLAAISKDTDDALANGSLTATIVI